MIKHGKARWAWVPGIPLVWDLVVTMTASYQKVFSDVPAIGYFAQRSRYADALAAGEVLAPATDAGQMQQVVTNSTTNGVLQAVFAVLVLVVVVNAAVVVVRALRAGSLPTTEVPHTRSRIVEPAGLFPTERGEGGHGGPRGPPRRRGPAVSTSHAPGGPRAAGPARAGLAGDGLVPARGHRRGPLGRPRAGLRGPRPPDRDPPGVRAAPAGPGGGLCGRPLLLRAAEGCWGC